MLTKSDSLEEQVFCLANNRCRMASVSSCQIVSKPWPTVTESLSKAGAQDHLSLFSQTIKRDPVKDVHKMDGCGELDQNYQVHFVQAT